LGRFRGQGVLLKVHVSGEARHDAAPHVVAVAQLKAVAQQLAAAAEEGGVDQPRTGPGFPAGRKALAVTAAMGKAADRRRWVDRYVSLPSDEQVGLLNAVKASLRNLEKLAAEFAAAVDDV
jgi:hypothetical protein